MGELKRRSLKNNEDLRGYRRLSLICDFTGQETPYSPSRLSKAKRSCYHRLPDILKPTRSPAIGFQLTSFTIFQAIGVPLILVAADVVTDGNLLFDMNDYIDTLYTSTETANEQGADALLGLFLASCFILAFSMLNLIFGNPAKTLIRNVRTSVLMGSRELESKDVPLPIDHLTRNELSVEESQGESGLQYCIQWLFYLILVSTAVRADGPDAATSITFVSLALSSTISIISLSIGQFKAHNLRTEYSTSAVQKILYILASLASTISTQLVLTNLWLAMADLGYPAGGLALAITLFGMPLLVGLLRMFILPRLLANAGHAANDLFLLDKEPQSILGRIKWLPTLYFNLYCSFADFAVAIFKVNILRCAPNRSVVCPKPKSDDFLCGEPAYPFYSPALNPDSVHYICL